MKKLVFALLLGTLGLGNAMKANHQSGWIPVPRTDFPAPSVFDKLVDAMVGILQQVHDYACTGVITRENIKEVVRIYENASKDLYQEQYGIIAEGYQEQLVTLARTVKLDEGKALLNLLDVIRSETNKRAAISPFSGDMISDAWDSASSRFAFVMVLPPYPQDLEELHETATCVPLSKSELGRVIMSSYKRALDIKLYWMNPIRPM